MPELPKPKCPECEKEISLTAENTLPDKCPGCGFTLKGFPAFTRWLRAANRAIAREEAEAKAKNKPKESSFFESFGNM